MSGRPENDVLDKEIQELYRLTVQDHAHYSDAEWMHELKAASTDTLVGLLAHLGSTGRAGARAEAFRESVRAELERRSTQQMVEQTERLEAGMQRLTVVALLVSVVGVVVAVVQCVRG